jgi:hypothetical protein
VSEAAAAARRCPKCDAALTVAAEACPACGLAVAHFDDFAAAESPKEEAHAALAPLWDACLADWDSAPTHEKFLAAAAAFEAFVHAGRLYRRAARERGSADPRVVAGLERVRRMAEAAWLTRPPGPAGESQDRGGYRTAALLLLSLLLLAGLGGITVYIVRTLRSGDPPTEEVRPAPTRQPPGRVGN